MIGDSLQKMLCHEFEGQLTDYLDGALEVQTNRKFAEHALRCPVCHDLLSEVKNTLLACSASEAPVPYREPSRALGAILRALGGVLGAVCFHPRAWASLDGSPSFT